jgi:trigger factor
METSFTQVSPVEYEFELHAPADALQPKVKQALQAQRSQMDIKGFRKGKVPLPMVKKMYGTALAMNVAEAFVQEAFEEALDERDDLAMLGQPEMTELEYEDLDDDLRAVVTFGVRPPVELKDLSDEHIPRLVHEVTDEDVEDEVENFLQEHADLVPLEDEPAGEDDFVNIDLQRMDPSTDTPIIGEKEEDLTFFLDDERLRDELRDALIGKQAGDTFRVRLPQDAPPEAGPEAPSEERLYEVAVHDVKRRDLPELDDALVQEITDDQVETVEELRDAIRDELESAWEQQSKEMVRGEIVDRMLGLHPLPVPESVTERFLDSFVQQVQQENDGELPEDFDEAFFRERNRDDAERQGHWMLIRDAIIEQAGLEVTDDDRDAFFADQAQRSGMPPEQLKQFYRQMPDAMDRVEQQILSDKVYDYLLEQFDVEEMDRDAFQEYMEEQYGDAHDPDHPHPHDH